MKIKFFLISFFIISIFFLDISFLYSDNVAKAKCEENRRTISGAIEIYYIEYPETYGMITIDMLLRSGALSEMVYCPEGGEYSIDENGDVFCSVHYKNPATEDVEPENNSKNEEISDDNSEVPDNENSEGNEQEEDNQLNEDNPFVRENEVAKEPKKDEEINLDDFINVTKFKKSEEKLITAQDLGRVVKRGGRSKFFVEKKDDNEKEEKIDKNKILTPFEYNEKGLNYASKMKFDKAITYFQKALDLSPDSKIYLFNLSLTYARNGNLKMAKYEIKRVLRLAPNNEKIKKLYNLIMKKDRELKLK